MRMRSVLAGGIALAVISAPPIMGIAALMPISSAVAQQSTLNLTGEGEGRLTIGSRPSQTVTFVTVSSQPNGRVEMTLRLADGNLQRWGGQLARQSGGEAQIDLRNSGTADATGLLTLRYQGSRLVSLLGEGTIDNQPMSIRFTIADDSASRPPQPPTVPPSNQAIACSGQMQNGWRYRAEAVNRRFTQVRWERTGQPPTVTTLRFERNNAQGEPVYRGAFRAATEVTLVDLSKNNPRSGSQISVGVEEWGWSRGTCR